jgi:nucleoside-diphosphate-sugar epimerase
MEMGRSLAPDKELLFGDVPFTGTDLPLEKFDCSETEKDTGFRAEISFFDGVRRTMDWIRKTEEKQR